MIDAPYVETLKLDEAFSAFSMFRLRSIATAQEQSDQVTLQALNRQSEFLSGLVGLGRDSALELRLISFPNETAPEKGRIDVVLRTRVNAATREEAKKKTVQLFRDLLPLLLSISDDYFWDIVSTAEDYNALLPETDDWHLQEMLRREEFLRLDQPSAIKARSRIGFIDVEDYGEAAASPDRAYLCFLYIRSYSTLETLFNQILRQESRVVLSTVIQPRRASEQEYEFQVSQLLNCERYMQLPVHGNVDDPKNFYPSLRQQSSVIGSQIQNELQILGDEVFFTTITLGSDRPISPLLCESIGTALTEHAHTADHNSDVATLNRVSPYNGGFEWVSPPSSAARREAIADVLRLRFRGLTDGLLDSAINIRRLFDIAQASCVFRLPVPIEGNFPGIRTNRVVQLPPPKFHKEGISLGLNEYASRRTSALFGPEDRLRHAYVVGKTGTGKSTFLKDCVMQDIMAGHGVGVFDPHGELVDEIICHIPECRHSDVVWIRPELADHSIGLNILDVKSDLEKDSVINYLIEVFDAIFDMTVAGGPMFEMYFRNSLLLLMNNRDGETCTIVDLHRVFEDSEFRNRKIDTCTDVRVASFWKEIASKASGEASLSNIAPYICSKLVRITHTFSMRNIFSQEKSTIDFEEVLEKKKILLVDLSKGELGAMSSHFLGMTLIKLIQTVAFRRQSTAKGGPSPYFLYFDEFQNLATPSFLELLSESRKYGLGITLANQYIQQIPEKIRNAIFGNVGSIVGFRVGVKDGLVLEDSFSPYVSAKDFTSLPNFNAYVSILINDDVSNPFNIVTQNTRYAEIPRAVEKLTEMQEIYTQRV